MNSTFAAHSTAPIRAASFVPTSPLIRLIESIPPKERGRYRNIRLSPALGYRSGARFMNAQHLLYWLKPHKRMPVGSSWLADQVKMQWFRKNLTVYDLLAHCMDEEIAA